jgi:hypothetical protein
MMTAPEEHTSHFYTLYISIYIISCLYDMLCLRCQQFHREDKLITHPIPDTSMRRTKQLVVVAARLAVLLRI